MFEPSGSSVPWAVGHPLRSGWLAGASLLLVPALLLGLAALDGPGSEVDRIVRSTFAPFCHQQLDRCLLFGRSLAVCARCAGFYAGLALVAVAGLGLGRGVQVRPIGLVGLLPLLVDGVANRFGLWASPASLRALTGVLAALPLALLVLGDHDEAR